MKTREEYLAAQKEYNKRRNRKGGESYDTYKKYNVTGIRGKRTRVRAIDGKNWRPFKKIIAPETEVHHLWKDGSAEFFGLAIVDISITRIHEDAEVMLDGYFNIGAKTGVCELCGEECRTHWHHPDGRVSVIALFACIEVCPKCHKAIEHMTVNEVEAYHKGIVREQREVKEDYLGGETNGRV
jgi:hypothetical protein